MSANRINGVWSWCFWKDALERAVSAMASTAVSITSVNSLIQALNWNEILSMSATTGVVSILTSVSALGFGKENTASFLPKTEVKPGYGKHSV